MAPAGSKKRQDENNAPSHQPKKSRLGTAVVDGIAGVANPARIAGAAQDEVKASLAVQTGAEPITGNTGNDIGQRNDGRSRVTGTCNDDTITDDLGVSTAPKAIVPRRNDCKANTPYLSPPARLRTMREEQKGEAEVISTVEGLQEYIKANATDKKPISRAIVKIKGRIVWASTHTVKTGELVRLHSVDLQALEPLGDMQAAFRDEYERDYLEVNQLLITATIFGCTAESAGIPPEGAIVTIKNPTKLFLFMGKACQFTTRLTDLDVADTKE
ncbi:hypothetical protein V7S43_017913 [Phytophthora oleae]|uniref:Uncharacterized protein n=1 Tax=Phytophthora oleae TaxID=2107226 RepID=A0ABD3ES01_9STRA